MKAFIKHLELISLVNSNYNHIQQLETLMNGYELMKEKEFVKEYPNEYELTQKQIDRLVVICKTTINNHYDMNLYLSKEYRDIDNEVDNVLLAIKILNT